ncbi:phosphohydrolase [Methylobacterium sp. Leaf102]|uniref:HD-GYP domain-containing protein n=1 Tax=Methylobacterium sp. Leaf102 TaxID=1736253 RepID=UPI0006F64851|nr:HD domain-containing phosphohydrolase [Methylobacterium sp. Leaf102]KQP32939.1 phosphohydrolase [Methylobacterium sp. Leaf102]
MNDGAILLLTDRPDRSAALETILNTVGRCEVLAGDGKLSLGTRPIAIVADLTLTRRESVGRLRAVLPVGQATPQIVSQAANPVAGRVVRIPVICLMRSTSDQDLRQARDLGATVCLPAYTAPHLVAQVIRDQVSARGETASGVSGQGIVRATEALTGLFAAAREGGDMALGVVEAGLTPILAAVREGGLTQWLDTVWTHDDATYQHCLLVAGVSAQFVNFLQFREQDRQHFVRAALLHDLGKARIPQAILNKPGRLDADEMAIMRTHPVIGYEILRDSGCDAATLSAVRHHHEMLDGSGYPDGLAGSAIGDTVRLLTICDIYAALTERRSYKPPMPMRDALAVLESMDTKLEAGLVRCFGDAMSATTA